MIAMTKISKSEALKRRESVQSRFWDEVGAVEHISLPRLKDAIEKEFGTDDDRFVDEQIRLMQTEARIKIVSHVKVWIRSPEKRENLCS